MERSTEKTIIRTSGKDEIFPQWDYLCVLLHYHTLHRWRDTKKCSEPQHETRIELPLVVPRTVSVSSPGSSSSASHASELRRKGQTRMERDAYSKHFVPPPLAQFPPKGVDDDCNTSVSSSVTHDSAIDKDRTSHPTNAQPHLTHLTPTTSMHLQNSNNNTDHSTQSLDKIQPSHEALTLHQTHPDFTSPSSTMLLTFSNSVLGDDILQHLITHKQQQQQQEQGSTQEDGTRQSRQLSEFSQEDMSQDRENQYRQLSLTLHQMIQEKEEKNQSLTQELKTLQQEKDDTEKEFEEYKVRNERMRDEEQKRGETKLHRVKDELSICEQSLQQRSILLTKEQSYSASLELQLTRLNKEVTQSDQALEDITRECYSLRAENQELKTLCDELLSMLGQRKQMQRFSNSTTSNAVRRSREFLRDREEHEEDETLHVTRSKDIRTTYHEKDNEDNSVATGTEVCLVRGHSIPLCPFERPALFF